jgi:hypothetical protein
MLIKKHFIYIVIIVAIFGCKLSGNRNQLIYTSNADSTFYKDSGIVIEILNNQQIENLSTLCKIWGFLKYYHPNVALGIYNWDFELFRVIPKVINCINKDERSEIIYDWIDILGKIEKCYNPVDTLSKDVKTLPDFDWIENRKIIDKKLGNQLKFIKENRRNGYHYYISRESPGNPIFKHENPYYKISFNDKGYRILTLFRYWNIIQYFFPYKYAIGEDWNIVLDKFIPKFINAKDELQYKLTVIELIARIHDTHAKIYQSDSVLENYIGRYGPAFQVKFIDKKAVITDFYDEYLGRKTTLKKGDIISKIDGISVEEIIKKKLLLTPGSNEPTQLKEIARYLLFCHNDKLKIEYIRDGKKNNVIINRYTSDKLNSLSYFYKKPDTCYKFIKNNIGYIYWYNQNRISTKDYGFF